MNPSSSAKPEIQKTLPPLPPRVPREVVPRQAKLNEKRGSFPSQHEAAMYPNQQGVKNKLQKPNRNIQGYNTHQSVDKHDSSSAGKFTAARKKIGSAIHSADRPRYSVAESTETVESGESQYKKGLSVATRRNHDPDQSSKIRQLENQLEKERELVEQTKKSATLLEKAMDNKDLFLEDQAWNDDEVRGKFESLMSKIKTWSNNFIAGLPDANAFQTKSLFEYRRVAPSCTHMESLYKLTTEKQNKRLFVRAWTAYVMTDYLFRILNSDPTMGGITLDIWMTEDLAKAFSELENEFWGIKNRNVISDRAFNDWRAFTAGLLAKSMKHDPQDSDSRARKAVQDAMDTVIELVGPWCSSPDPDAIGTYTAKLEKIFVEAAELAKFLRRQRPLWSIRFPTNSEEEVSETGSFMIFDPKTMSDQRGHLEDTPGATDRQSYVDLVVTPALFKRGNADGERFDREEAVVKAMVILRDA